MEYDEALGVIRSTVAGMQTETEAHAFMASLEQTIAIAKARTGRVLHLVDATGAAVQSRSTADTFAGYAEAGMMGIEKIAVILDSALLKMQSQRLYGGLPLALFTNQEDALEWLRAE